MKVIIDTNAWLACNEVDLFTAVTEVVDTSYTLCVLQGTMEELEKIISEQRGKHKRNAVLALSLIKTKVVKVLPSIGHVDELLVAYSKKGDLVLTLDRELKRKLKKPYLTIRQRKRVVKVG